MSDFFGQNGQINSEVFFVYGKEQESRKNVITVQKIHLPKGV